MSEYGQTLGHTAAVFFRPFLRGGFNGSITKRLNSLRLLSLCWSIGFHCKQKATKPSLVIDDSVLLEVVIWPFVAGFYPNGPAPPVELDRTTYSMPPLVMLALCFFKK